MEQKTIGDIVDEYIIERGYDSRHEFPRLLNMAIRGLKEMNLDVAGEPTFSFLELDSNSTAAIPCGVINILGLYFNDQQFGMLEIVESSSLQPTVVRENGEEVRLPADDPDNIGDYYAGGNYGSTAGNFRVGQFTGGFYKGSQPNPYMYRRNYDTNRLEFSSNVSNPVIEYLTDAKLVDGKHVVIPVMEDALMWYLHHADNRFKDHKNVSVNTKAYNHRMYLAAKNKVARRLANVTAGNMRAGGRAGYSLTTK